MYVEGEAEQLPGEWNVANHPVVNDDGLIAWDHLVGSGQIDIYRFDGDEVEQVTDNGLSNQSPRVNLSGDIAWARKDFFQSPWRSTVMLYKDGTVLELTDGEGQAKGVDLNDAGQVVWSEPAGIKDAIKMWDAGTVTILAEGSNARINKAGDIAYASWNFATEKWDQMLLTEGIEYVLPDFGFSSAGSEINDRREVAWRVLVNDFGDTGILML